MVLERGLSCIVCLSGASPLSIVEAEILMSNFLVSGSSSISPKASSFGMIWGRMALRRLPQGKSMMAQIFLRGPRT